MKFFKKNPPSEYLKRFDFKLWIPFSIIAITMICLWIYGAANIYSMFSSLQWPSTTGTIIRSEIKRTPGSYRSTASSKEAIIIYRYKLNDVVFSSNRVLWGGQSYSAGFSEPDQLVKKYPAGKTVSVYYNPEKAAESVLEKRARIIDYGFVGFCSFVLFLQSYFLVYLWKKIA